MIYLRMVVEIYKSDFQFVVSEIRFRHTSYLISILL